MERINSISIFGSSSGRNAGDAALISGIMDTVDETLGRRLTYEIPTYKPNYIWKNYPNKVRPLSMCPWALSVGMFGPQTISGFLRSDLAVVYDNMLFDRSLLNPLFNYMPAVWFLFKHLKRANQLLGLYNCGLGPITTPRGEKMLSEILDVVDFITVRDQDSVNLAEKLGATKEKIILTADAAVTVPPCKTERAEELIRASGLDPLEPIIGINVNSYLNTWAEGSQSKLTPQSFAEIYGKALTVVANETRRPLLFITTQPGDIEITKLVMNNVKSPNKIGFIENSRLNHFEIKGILGKLEFLFAMRLHANILATSMLTPAVSLAFQKKVTSYYTELGLPENVASFEKFSAESISTHVLNGWTNRNAIREKLTSNIPLLQRRARATGLLIKALDNGSSTKEALEICRRELRQIPSTSSVNFAQAVN